MILKLTRVAQFFKLEFILNVASTVNLFAVLQPSESTELITESPSKVVECLGIEILSGGSFHIIQRLLKAMHVATAICLNTFKQSLRFK